METVVEENPLSLATSRIVTIKAFSPVLSPRSTPVAKPAAKTAAIKTEARASDSPSDFQASPLLNSTECWRTLQQRLHPVSSIRIEQRLLRTWPGILLSLLLGAAMVPASAQNSSPTSAAKPQISDAPAAAREHAKQQAALIFQHGEDALNRGRLNEAERDFRQILALDPQAGAAYANLGVVYMRRKQWTKALEMLRKAQRMLPQMAGIRLNIGLAYYRQNEFLLAVPLFESVVRDQPDALQARYLLGQCYFFASRWADAADTLEPLWPLESTQLNYLYV